MTTYLEQAEAQLLSTLDSLEVLERRLLMAFFAHADVDRAPVLSLNEAGETIPIEALRDHMRLETQILSGGSGAWELELAARETQQFRFLMGDMRSLFSPVATKDN